MGMYLAIVGMVGPVMAADNVAAIGVVLNSARLIRYKSHAANGNRNYSDSN